jgi:hypothetical protein
LAKVLLISFSVFEVFIITKKLKILYKIPLSLIHATCLAHTGGGGGGSGGGGGGGVGVAVVVVIIT